MAETLTWVAQCPAVLEYLIFVLLGVLDVESSLKPTKRRLTSDLFFNFLEGFQAILYDELCCLLGEVIHFLSAHPEEVFPTEFVETSQTFAATHDRRRADDSFDHASNMAWRHAA